MLSSGVQRVSKPRCQMVHITISPPGPRDPASRATTGPAGLAWEKKQAKEKWQQGLGARRGDGSTLDFLPLLPPPDRPQPGICCIVSVFCCCRVKSESSRLGGSDTASKPLNKDRADMGPRREQFGTAMNNRQIDQGS
ncbi:unnamed protein product [Gadus morhua 'NCC']